MEEDTRQLFRVLDMDFEAIKLPFKVPAGLLGCHRSLVLEIFTLKYHLGIYFGALYDYHILAAGFCLC